MKKAYDYWQTLLRTKDYYTLPFSDRTRELLRQEKGGLERLVFFILLAGNFIVMGVLCLLALYLVIRLLT